MELSRLGDAEALTGTILELVEDTHSGSKVVPVDWVGRLDLGSETKEWRKGS